MSINYIVIVVGQNGCTVTLTCSCKGCVLCSKLLNFKRRFVTTILAGPPSFRHMLELKIRSLTCIFYITQFQLSSDAGETFVKSTIFASFLLHKNRYFYKRLSSIRTELKLSNVMPYSKTSNLKLQHISE